MKLTDKIKQVLVLFVETFQINEVKTEKDITENHQRVADIIIGNEEIRNFVILKLIQRFPFMERNLVTFYEGHLKHILFNLDKSYINGLLAALVITDDDSTVMIDSDLIEDDGLVPDVAFYILQQAEDPNFTISGLLLKDILEYAKNLENKLEELQES